MFTILTFKYFVFYRINFTGSDHSALRLGTTRTKSVYAMHNTILVEIRQLAVVDKVVLQTLRLPLIS